MDFISFHLHPTGAKSCSFKVWKRTVSKTIFEEEAGAGDIGTFVPSLTRAMRKDGKLHEWLVDTRTRQDQKAREREKTVHVPTRNGLSQKNLSQHGHGFLNLT